MMYISTDVLNNETNIDLVDNLWNHSSFGMPNWEKLFNKFDRPSGNKVFYSGPSKFSRTLKKACAKKGIVYKKGSFQFKIFNLMKGHFCPFIIRRKLTYLYFSCFCFNNLTLWNIYAKNSIIKLSCNLLFIYEFRQVK